jgi:peptidoglycan/xylan/chitin deacetylase (PgdA/CDA1 family)
MMMRHSPHSSSLMRGRPRFPGLPLFVYHGLVDRTEPHIDSNDVKYWVPIGQFTEQLDQIRQAGCRVLLLKHLESIQADRAGCERHTVLTFDDGRASDYLVAYPQLVERRLSAEFFLNTAKIDTPGFLTWQEIREMQGQGMSFQSHSHEHLDLTRLSSEDLERQLDISKRTLEDRLGCSVDFLAAPCGLVNRQVIDCALRLGYRAVCSARSLPARPGALKLDRVVIYRSTTVREFRQLLNCEPSCYLRRIARSPFYRVKNLLVKFRPLRTRDKLPEIMA